MALPVLIAARNPVKTAQMRELLSGLDLELTDGAAAGDMLETSEEGQSHLANAIEKAVAGSRHTGGVAAVSDGGLSIPALGDGWSSLITRRGDGQGHPGRGAGAALAATDAGRRGRAARVSLDRVGRCREIGGADRRMGGERITGLHRARLRSAGRCEQSVWVSGLWVTQAGKRRWQLSDAELEGLGDPWGALEMPLRDLLGRLRQADSSGAPHH